MINIEDLIEYFQSPKVAIKKKYSNFFDEVYKLSSLEIHNKINKLTKGFNRLDQLISLYNLYNSYVHFKSNPGFLKRMSIDEFTLFKRDYDVVKFNDLKLITLHENNLIFETFEALNYLNIDVFKRQTFSDILESLILMEYNKRELQQNVAVSIKRTEKSLPQYIPKPCFKPELVDSLIEELKPYFDSSNLVELRRIIETGTNTNEKLLFRENGNKLTDYFKTLIENSTITGCTKKDLINWIVKNFKYYNRGTDNEYNFKTVEKIISTKERRCKNPIR